MSRRCSNKLLMNSGTESRTEFTFASSSQAGQFRLATERTNRKSLLHSVEFPDARHFGQPNRVAGVVVYAGRAQPY